MCTREEQERGVVRHCAGTLLPPGGIPALLLLLVLNRLKCRLSSGVFLLFGNNEAMRSFREAKSLLAP